MRLSNVLDKKEDEKRPYMRNRRRNRVKAFSLLLLKEKGTAIGEGTPIGERRNDGGKKPSPFPI